MSEQCVGVSSARLSLNTDIGMWWGLHYGPAQETMCTEAKRETREHKPQVLRSVYRSE